MHIAQYFPVRYTPMERNRTYWDKNPVTTRFLFAVSSFHTLSLVGLEPLLSWFCGVEWLGQALLQCILSRVTLWSFCTPVMSRLEMRAWRIAHRCAEIGHKFWALSTSQKSWERSTVIIVCGLLCYNPHEQNTIVFPVVFLRTNVFTSLSLFDYLWHRRFHVQKK